jgi:CHASE1-domain containing sensor protein
MLAYEVFADSFDEVFQMGKSTFLENVYHFTRTLSIHTVIGTSDPQTMKTLHTLEKAEQ